MAFATKTINPNDPLISTDWNTYVRDAILYLGSGRPITFTLIQSASADFTTASTSFVDIDSTVVATVTTGMANSRVLVIASIPSVPPAAASMFLDIMMDGTTRPSGDGTNGLMQVPVQTNAIPATVFGYFTGLSAASHSFKVQYRAQSGTATVKRSSYPIEVIAIEV